jgi:hypothetical protein
MLATSQGYAPVKLLVSRGTYLPWGMAIKSPEPAREGPDQSGQRPDQDHDSAPSPGDYKSRRQIIDEGLDFVLRHDAALLLRLADA